MNNLNIWCTKNTTMLHNFHYKIYYLYYIGNLSNNSSFLDSKYLYLSTVNFPSHMHNPNSHH